MTVTIVGYRNPPDIARCLEALQASTHQDFDVVICENGGAAAYAALSGMLPARLPAGQSVRLVQAPRNLGYGGGLNLCFGETPTSDAWWALNPDTRPEPDAMAHLVARLEVGDCDAVGCTVCLPDGRVQSYGGRWRAWAARAVSIGYGSAIDAPVDAERIERTQNYLNGAAMMIGRRFLALAGPMREEYFLYCEEVEWCLRAASRGARLGFEPKARVLHYQGTTTGNPPDIAQRSRLSVYLNERNKILTTRDRFVGWLPIAAPAALATVIVRYARRWAWRQLCYALAGWSAGVRDERGQPAWSTSV